MRSARFAVAVVIALVFGFVVGTAIDRGSPALMAEPSMAPPTSTHVSAESGQPGPSKVRAGMPVGFARDEAGARAAAMAYAAASQRWLYFDDAGVEAAVAAISTTSATPSLTRDVLDEVRLARESLASSPGRVWWVVRPLAVSIETFNPDRARVAVWTVTVLSASDVALPQSDWTTVTFDLAWDDRDWRVDAVVDEPGPTPMTGPRDQPWQPEPFDEALDGFERVDVGER